MIYLRQIFNLHPASPRTRDSFCRVADEKLRPALDSAGGRLAAAWPFTRYADLPLRVGHADWFDRLSVPSTVYFSQADVEAWFDDAGLQDVVVQSRDGTGWRAVGRSPLASAAAGAGEQRHVSASEFPKDGLK